jgi:hypothetical protein
MDGPRHRYVGGSAACWRLFGWFQAGGWEVTASSADGSVVDAYTAQHPGRNTPQARQSVAVHIVALHAALIRGHRPEALYAVRVAAVQWGRDFGFPWLDKPAAWPLTLRDVVSCDDPFERSETLRAWVTGVYDVWAGGCAGLISGWYDGALSRM